MASADLTSLLRQTHLDDHEEVLKAANGALKKSKTDIQAHYVKVVALLNLDRFDDAARVFEEGGQALKEQASLEYAYALYKTGKLEEAEKVARSSDQRGYKHVLAQTSYRAEKFKTTAELYAQLAAQGAHDEENDIRINSSAADAQLEWAGQGELVKKKKPTREDMEGFEAAYNAACGSIARGELGQGEVLLKRAKDLCTALDDLSEEEKKAETLPILVQTIYVLTRQGKLQEAKTLADSLSITDIPDASTRQVAQVNSLTTSLDISNTYLAHRILNAPTKEANKDLPFHFQSTILTQDSFALDILSQKFSGVINTTNRAISSQPSPTADPAINTQGVLNAAAHAKNHTGKEGIKTLLPLLEKRSHDIGLLLTVIQLYVLTNNADTAINLLSAFLRRLAQEQDAERQAIRFTPGLVALTSTLYTSQNRHKEARQIVSEAARYHLNRWKKDSSSPVPANVFKAAGVALLDSQEAEDLSLAGELFSEVLEQDVSDGAATAGLIAAYATIDSSKISSNQTDSLTPIPRLTSTVNVSALEEAGIPHLPTQPSSTAATRKRTADSKPQPSKAKKLRKTKTPKDYDPAKAASLDKERWLPMRDRSYYKPKRVKGKKRVDQSTQGGVVEERPSTPQSTPGVVSGPTGGGQKKKKEKKK